MRTNLYTSSRTAIAIMARAYFYKYEITYKKGTSLKLRFLQSLCVSYQIKVKKIIKKTKNSNYFLNIA